MAQVLVQTPMKARLAMVLAMVCVCAGCATQPVQSGDIIPHWASASDCFSRNVAATDQNAERMALACSGPQAGADPNRSGVDRATAYFNAATGYTHLAASGSTSLACGSSAACYQFALKFIEKSYDNQEDALIAVNQSSIGTNIDGLFVLRRKLVHAQALMESAQSGNSACAEPDDCLNTAAEALAAYDFESFAASGDEPITAIACQALDLNARINALRGVDHEYAAVTSLRSIVRYCPSFSDNASGKLAQIAFDRGEQLRKSMLDSIISKAPPAESAALGASAVISYRDALRAETPKLPAYRGLGSVYLDLAVLQPGNAAEHYEAAAEAFDSAQKISSGAAGESHSEDLTQLGDSYLKLVDAKRQIETEEKDSLINAAIRVLEKSVLLSPTYSRQLMLGNAYEQSGRNKDAEATYRSAMAAGESSANDSATLALARLLERTNKADEALAVLETGFAAGLQTPSVRYEIGRLRFSKSNFEGAIDALSPVVGKFGDAQTAEAHYMLSVAEAVLRRSGWQARARTHADAAAQANSFSAKYSRQLCLSHIVSGGSDVRTGASLQRCPVDDTPEKHLLRGMYFLKQAQLLDVSAYDSGSQDYWRSVLRLAEDSFQSGQQTLKLLPVVKSKLRFDDLGRDIDLAVALAQGTMVVERCRRETSIETGSQTWKELESFFGHYGVLKCSAS